MRYIKLHRIPRGEEKLLNPVIMVRADTVQLISEESAGTGIVISRGSNFGERFLVKESVERVLQILDSANMRNVRQPKTVFGHSEKERNNEL